VYLSQAAPPLALHACAFFAAFSAGASPRLDSTHLKTRTSLSQKKNNTTQHYKSQIHMHPHAGERLL
jgi:hypothetical protein